jgi:hypothetical protein
LAREARRRANARPDQSSPPAQQSGTTFSAERLEEAPAADVLRKPDAPVQRLVARRYRRPQPGGASRSAAAPVTDFAEPADLSGAGARHQRQPRSDRRLGAVRKGPASAILRVSHQRSDRL